MNSIKIAVERLRISDFFSPEMGRTLDRKVREIQASAEKQLAEKKSALQLQLRSLKLAAEEAAGLSSTLQRARARLAGAKAGIYGAAKYRRLQQEVKTLLQRRDALVKEVAVGVANRDKWREYISLDQYNEVSRCIGEKQRDIQSLNAQIDKIWAKWHQEVSSILAPYRAAVEAAEKNLADFVRENGNAEERRRRKRQIEQQLAQIS